MKLIQRTRINNGWRGHVQVCVLAAVGVFRSLVEICSLGFLTSETYITLLMSDWMDD